MAFGTVLGWTKRPGGKRPAPRGKSIHFYCDGGCTPNPGRSEPVVHDGIRFHRVRPRFGRGTNNRAVYDAVEYVLREAIRLTANHVTIELASELAFRQLSTGRYCRNATLTSRRDLCLTLADRIPEVQWILSAPPYILGTVKFTTARRIRQVAKSQTRRSVITCPCLAAKSRRTASA